MVKNISVIGLGKLGSPFLATCASRGFKTIGLDINQKYTDIVNKGKPPVYEPYLAELITKNKNNLMATQDWKYAISNSEITFVIVPTPSLKNGAFSNEYIKDAVTRIAKELKLKNSYHLVVIVSTIMPQTMEKTVVPILQKYSGKKAGKDFGVCYSPEFIALGSVINNLLSPDFVLIGELDFKSGKILSSFYKKFCINKPPIAHLNFINAEISKIALNSYITTKITFANTLAQICQKVSGGDADIVTQTLGMDTRIGKKYFKGGLPFGGPCFPRDNRAFTYFAKEINFDAHLSIATDKVNEKLVHNLCDDIITSISKKATIAILGLSYKKDTDVVEESAGMKLANYFSKKGYKVKVWDPIFSNKFHKGLNTKIKMATSLKNCVANSHITIIATDHDIFKNLSPNIFSKIPKPVLLDCWRILDPLKYQDVVIYRTIGINFSK